jgi:hypothetical protein
MLTNDAPKTCRAHAAAFFAACSFSYSMICLDQLRARQYSAISHVSCRNAYYRLGKNEFSFGMT